MPLTEEIKKKYYVDVPSYRELCISDVFLCSTVLYFVYRKAGQPPESMMKKERRPVEDGVVIIDCGPCLRRFGLARFARCNNLWCVKDICGIICVVLTWLLVVYAEYVVMFIMLIPSPNPYYGLANAILFNFLAFLALASHSKAMLSDPVS